MSGDSDRLLVTVITVVRNNPEGLVQTMDSVKSQDYEPLEYIVIDGASTDETISVLRTRAGELSRWISEPDNGIYEAMNKGARLATGEYICFMNAGDRFASRDAITRFFVPRPVSELVWGDCIIESDAGEEYDCARDVVLKLYRQMTVCHQSLFTKRTALLARPYDESFRIAADYDFLCERLLAGASWEYRPVPVSRIDNRGVSARTYRTSISEKKRISLFRFPSRRISITLYYCILGIYMRAKPLLKALHAR